jgi:hypothetical protein
MSTVLEPSIRSQPYWAEVEEFAKKQHVLEFLPQLWEVVAHLFPNADLGIELQRDPEILGLGWIVFFVEKTELDQQGVSLARHKWREARARLCANPDTASNFTLQIRD